MDKLLFNRFTNLMLMSTIKNKICTFAKISICAELIFLFLLLAKMFCNLWVLVGSAIHNVHNTIKGCNTGTSWISADSDSKLGKFVCV